MTKKRKRKKKETKKVNSVSALIILFCIFLISFGIFLHFIEKEKLQELIKDPIAKIFNFSKEKLKADMFKADIISSTKDKYNGCDPSDSKSECYLPEYSSCVDSSDINDSCYFDVNKNIPGKVFAKFNSDTNSYEITDKDIEHAKGVFEYAATQENPQLKWEYNPEKMEYKFLMPSTAKDTKHWCCYLKLEPLFAKIFTEVKLEKFENLKIENFSAKINSSSPKDTLNKMFKPEAKVQWDNIEDANSYTVYYDLSSDFDNPNTIETKENSLKIDSLDVNKIYYLKVEANFKYVPSVKISSDTIKISTNVLEND